VQQICGPEYGSDLHDHHFDRFHDYIDIHMHRPGDEY
jgi:hypothetical protein